jgi:hypothetical protein
MEHWDGKDAMEEANKKNYVVDYLGNNGFYYLVSNLFIIPKMKNSTKGLHMT